MAEPIRNARINNLAEAPTPQNTPATQSSFIQRASDGKPNVSTISEEENGLNQKMALLSMIEGKLGNLVSGDFTPTPKALVAQLPKSVRNRVHGLKAIQAEHAILEQELENEILALEKKYHKLYQPLYSKRAEIVNGLAEPTPEEIEDGRAIEKEEEEEDFEQEEKPRLEEITEEDADNEDAAKESDAKESDVPKGIPDFWSTALKNIPILADGITERDEEALHYLTDLRMEYLETPGFQLIFEFAENPFFTNKELVKSYHYAPGQTGFDGEYTLEKAVGTEIDWKSPDKDLTVKIEQRKQRNKHTKATRTIEKKIPQLSFFSFFSPPNPASTEDDEEEDEGVSEQLEFDYRNGEAIRDAIPRAIDWFTGIALRYEGDDSEFEDEDEFEVESDEDDSETDDNDDDDERAGKTAGAESGECKQQ